MARPLRIEFPAAIYHVMSRGNARQTVFRDDSDYQRLSKGLETVVGRLGWDLLCFVLMPNHFHLLVRTPRPNLSRGMQHLTSGYANWCSRRHRRPGHTFQGRFKSELIEDESYFWTVSRYIHLNPVRGKRPLADHPRTGPGRAIRATTAGGGALDGWPTRLCIRPGVASRAATISRGGLPAVRRAGTGEGSGKPLSVRGAWLAAGQRDVHRADAIAAERAEKPRRGARSPAVGQPGRGDSPGRSGSVLRC